MIKLVAVLVSALFLAQDLPTFEVAEIKPSLSNTIAPSQITKSGHLRLTGLPLRLLISAAWQVREDSVAGGPAWLDSERFDVIANSGPETQPKDLQLMLRSLLIERFHLSVHIEQRPRQVYALSVGKGALNLKESPAGNTQQTGCTGGREEGMAVRQCRNMTMDALARILPGISPHYVDAPVVNRTGLSGHYDFKLTWRPQQLDGKGVEAPTGPTIIDALLQLGLKLEGKKLPMPTAVVDQVDRL